MVLVLGQYSTGSLGSNREEAMCGKFLRYNEKVLELVNHDVATSDSSDQEKYADLAAPQGSHALSWQEP